MNSIGFLPRQARPRKTIRVTLSRTAMEAPLRAAILVVSTTAASDPSTDASTAALKDVLREAGVGQWELAEEGIVADDVLAIQRKVMAWADGPAAANLVVTTGGTGFAVSDLTPEVRNGLPLSPSACKARLTKGP